MNPLKIEVTEAMSESAAESMAMGGWDAIEYHVQGRFVAMAQAALTAAFQHPEFVRQIREQVMACVPERSSYFENADINQTRASLGRLLGEEKDGNNPPNEGTNT